MFTHIYIGPKYNNIIQLLVIIFIHLLLLLLLLKTFMTGI